MLLTKGAGGVPLIKNPWDIMCVRAHVFVESVYYDLCQGDIWRGKWIDYDRRHSFVRLGWMKDEEALSVSGFAIAAFTSG